MTIHHRLHHSRQTLNTHTRRHTHHHRLTKTINRPTTLQQPPHHRRRYHTTHTHIPTHNTN
ncbi:hypothetical protein ACFWSF_40790, partial [Streptomyces sp. NPDC058611]